MKTLFIGVLLLFNLKSYSQSWTDWISIDNGIEISFKLAETCSDYSFVKLRNNSNSMYTQAYVTFDTYCNGTMEANSSINGFDLSPGTIYESRGNWFMANGVNNIRLNKLLDANYQNLITY